MPPRPARLAVLILLLALPLSAVEDAADLATRKARLDKEVGELRALEAASSAGTVLLAEIVRSVPELLWLEAMSLRAGRVHVSGRAMNTEAVTSFMEQLDAVPTFAEATLIDMVEDPEEESSSFQVSLRFSPLPPEETSEEKKAAASGLRAEVAALERERDEISRRLARREDVPRLLDELRTAARELDLGSSSFVEARAGSPKMARIDVDLSATIHGLTMLFERLKTLSGMVTLDELTVRQELTERGTIAASFRLRVPLRNTAEAGPVVAPGSKP